MRFRSSWLALASLASLAVPAFAQAAVADSTGVGPSTVTPPYVLPLASRVEITSLLTVADAGSASNGYEMVGIPDGLGAFTRQNNVVVYMNHELTNSQGIVRQHGQIGSFVSRLVMSPVTGEILKGSDLMKPGIKYWNYLTSQYDTAPNPPGSQPDGDVFPGLSPAFSRFCSGTLAPAGRFFNSATGAGYQGGVYFANEENGDEARVLGVSTSGRTTQLPRLGLASWENTIPAANTTDTTLVLGTEDSSAGQLWAYVGTKTDHGAPMRRAGLTNGKHYAIDLLDETVSTDVGFRAKFPKGTPAPFNLSKVDWDQSGVDQNSAAASSGLSLNRIEDGTFDPSNPNNFYFVTTEGAPGEGRDGGGLWRASFTDINEPALGGTLTLLLDGSEAPYLNKPDNITIDQNGNMLIQEDPGLSDHLARIVAYRISDGARVVLAQFDAAQFTTGQPGFLTTDEESSGIIDTEATLGAGTFLFDAQVHVAPPDGVTEYVQRGQLLSMHVDWAAARYVR